MSRLKALSVLGVSSVKSGSTLSVVLSGLVPFNLHDGLLRVEGEVEHVHGVLLVEQKEPHVLDEGGFDPVVDDGLVDREQPEGVLSVALHHLFWQHCFSTEDDIVFFTRQHENFVVEVVVEVETAARVESRQLVLDARLQDLVARKADLFIHGAGLRLGDLREAAVEEQLADIEDLEVHDALRQAGPQQDDSLRGGVFRYLGQPGLP